MFGQANTSIIFHWFQPTRRRGMGEQLVAHAAGNCKPCSFFFFKEQCHSTYDKWQEVYGCFGICMHLNDFGWGCRTQDSTGGRVGRGGEIKKRSEGQKYATTFTCNTWWWALRTCLTLGSSGFIRFDASTNGFSCGSGRWMPTRKFLLILSFVQLSNIAFFFEIPRVWLKGRP